jgi:hypothetical protein
MARPFKNSSSANKAFGVFSESNTAGDYINNKKTTARYCNANKCTPSLKIGSESDYLLFKRAKKLSVYPCLNSINKSNLNINLITKMDLTNVPVIQNFYTGAVPTTITTTADPFLDYNIDPSGNLFGNTICGINNFVRYMVYDTSYNTINPGHINSL